MHKQELRKYLYAARGWVEQANLWHTDLTDPKYNEMYRELISEVFPASKPDTMCTPDFKLFFSYMVSFMKSTDQEGKPFYCDNVVEFPCQNNIKPDLRIVS